MTLALFHDPIFATSGVIDAESYWMEPPDLWTSRAPARFRDRVPQVQASKASTAQALVFDAELEPTRWVIDQKTIMARGTVSAFDAHNQRQPVAHGLPRLDSIAPATSAKERVALLDEQGIAAQVLYPSVAGLSGTHFSRLVAHSELALECVRTYNDAAAELQRDSGGRLLAQGLLPAQPGEAIVEAQRAWEELGLTGFCISDDQPDVDAPDLGEDAWLPLWEFANANNVPFSIRVGGNRVDTTKTVWGSYTSEEQAAIFTATVAMTLGPTIGNFLISGIYDRFPNLRMVLVGSHAGWLPFYIEIAQYQYAEMVGTVAQRIKGSLSDYFRTHWRVTVSAEEEAIRDLRGFLTDRGMLFSTRYPAPGSLSSSEQQPVREVFAAIPPDARRKILHDNAAELYRVREPVASR